VLANLATKLGAVGTDHGESPVVLVPSEWEFCDQAVKVRIDTRAHRIAERQL
jgi:hypothetical protein